MWTTSFTPIETPGIPQLPRYPRSPLDVAAWWANRIAGPVMVIVGAASWSAIIALYLIAILQSSS